MSDTAVDQATDRRRPAVLAPGGFVSIPHAVLASDAVGLLAKLVYGVILDHVGQNAGAWPSQPRLASLLKVSERGVRNAVGELVDAGFITATTRHGQSTFYRFNPLPTPERIAGVDSADPGTICRGTPEQSAGVQADPGTDCRGTPEQIAGVPRQTLPVTPANFAAEPLQEPLHQPLQENHSTGGDAPPVVPTSPPAEHKAAKRKRPKPEPEPLPPISAELDTPEFRGAWAEWVACRAENKKAGPLTARAAKIQLEDLRQLNPAAATKVVRRSISGNWQSIYVRDEDLAGAKAAASPGPSPRDRGSESAEERAQRYAERQRTAAASAQA